MRKFTRKPKKENLPKEELVLEPQEYKPANLSKEEAYRQSFLYWKSWHDELIASLSSNNSRKRKMDCSQEALKNLEELRLLLNPAMREKLDPYINQLKEVGVLIDKDTYGAASASQILSLERLRREILKAFSYNKIKEHLI